MSPSTYLSQMVFCRNPQVGLRVLRIVSGLLYIYTGSGSAQIANVTVKSPRKLDLGASKASVRAGPAAMPMGEGVLLRPLKLCVPVRLEGVIGCYPGVAEQIVVHGKDLGA